MCYRIRRGQSVPHWRHWEPIRSAVATYQPPEAAEWQRLATDTYEREIGPVLRTLPTLVVRAATCWSESYVSLARRGHYIPHWRHWPTLLKLVRQGRTPSAENAGAETPLRIRRRPGR